MARAAIIVALIVLLQCELEHVSADENHSVCGKCDNERYYTSRIRDCNVIYRSTAQGETCFCESDYRWHCEGRIPVKSNCGNCNALNLGQKCILNQTHYGYSYWEHACVRTSPSAFDRTTQTIWNETGVFAPDHIV